MLVVVEGGAFASALCIYLREFEAYKHLILNPLRPFHRQLMQWESILQNTPDVVIEGSHLGNLNRGIYTEANAKIVDQTLAELGFKLIWAIGEGERFSINRSIIGTAYYHSSIRKIVFIESKPITSLVKWIKEDNRDVLQSAHG